MSKKLLYFRVLAIVAALTCAFGSSAADIYDFEYNNLQFVITGSTTCKVVGHVVQSPSGNYNIPDVANGYYVTEVGGEAFCNCDRIISISLGNNVETIGAYAFQGCSSMTSFTFSPSLKTIKEFAFDGCVGLKSIVIPATVTTIGLNPFYGCTGLTSLSVASGNPVYDSHGNCNAIIETAANTLISGIATTEIPDGVTILSFYAFGGISNLTSITIPNTVILIRQYAFGNTGLTSVAIPNSVINVEGSAFYTCSALTDVVLGTNCRFYSGSQASEQAFYQCNSLSTVTSLNPVAWSYTYANNFPQNTYINGVLRVPKGSKSSYQSTNCWNQFAHIEEIPDLDDALNVAGGNIQFTSTDDYPWVVKEDNYRVYAQSGNGGVHNSVSELTATVTVEYASSLSFDFKAWGEGSNYDVCSFSIDGTTNLSYGARQNNWETYIVELPAGTHTLKWQYRKDGSQHPEGDYFAVDNVTVRSNLDPALNVDGGDIHFMSTGNYPWKIKEADGRTYAQSGNAGVKSSLSIMTATVTLDKPSTLSFDFKAWGEGYSSSPYDVCRFAIDEVTKFYYGARDNDWETYTVDLPAGTHTLKWTYQKDGSTDPEGDYFAVDNVAIRPSLDAALNVDGGTIHFTSTGDYPWVTMSDGIRDYAQSSNAGVHNSTSVLTTTVTLDNASKLSFDFKAWGEGSGYDVCEFVIDGAVDFAVGAYQNDWETYTLDNIPAGTHTLIWRYTKDNSVNPTGDYFAIDNVAFTASVDLDAVLNVDGGTIHFTNEGDYPWVVKEGDGRVYVQSSNEGIPSSSSVLTASVHVDEASILTFDFKAWGEGVQPAYDECIFMVNGRSEFRYGALDNDWETYSVELKAGNTYRLIWEYHKDTEDDGVGDYFALDNVKVEPKVKPGDVDMDGNVNIADVTALIDYLLSGDDSAISIAAADCDDSGNVNIADVTALIDYLLSGSW